MYFLAPLQDKVNPGRIRDGPTHSNITNVSSMTAGEMQEEHHISTRKVGAVRQPQDGHQEDVEAPPQTTTRWPTLRRRRTTTAAR